MSPSLVPPKQNIYSPSALTPTASRLQRSASVPKFASLAPPPHAPRRKKKQSFLPKFSAKLRIPQHNDPYPLNYEKCALNCDALDHLALKNLRKSSSWVHFDPDALPQRSLDLGCGTGTWVVDAAAEWPQCHFIGFDLVDIQPPPHMLAPQIAPRIKWIHGSFLSRLPFDDGYFDHVHIRHIARGVPEDKWDALLAEVVRVLKPGGTVELFEEDIIFPVLPRSSTATPQQRDRKRSTILRPSHSVTKHHSAASLPPHDHAVLETLFYRVFERRFVNLRPTALIMCMLDVHLRGAVASPLINFPLPPAPPLPSPSPSGSRSSTPMPARDMDEDTLVDLDADMSTGSSRHSASAGSTPATSVAELEDPADGPVAFYSDAGVRRGGALLPEERLAVTAGTLGLNLYRSWQGVLACREALWDEFCDAVRGEEMLLAQLDWEEDELLYTDRQRFDALLLRYRTDMEARYPISDALVADLRWEKPHVEVSKTDLGARQAVAEARRDALRLERSGIGAVPEASRVCRKGRVFVGSKGRVYARGVCMLEGA